MDFRNCHPLVSTTDSCDQCHLKISKSKHLFKFGRIELINLKYQDSMDGTMLITITLAFLTIGDTLTVYITKVTSYLQSKFILIVDGPCAQYNLFFWWKHLTIHEQYQFYYCSSLPYLIGGTRGFSRILTTVRSRTQMYSFP